MAENPDVLSSDLYLFPFAAVRIKPWVKGANGIYTRGLQTTAFTPIGDCDDVKTSWTVERKQRKSRNQGTQVTTFNKVTFKQIDVSWKAMQFSGVNRAMSLFASIEGASGTGPLDDEVDIGTEDQYDVEVEVEALGPDGSQGTLILYRVQLATEGDYSWASGDDFAGADFKGTALAVPGLGKNGKASLGKFVPFSAA